MPKVSIVMELEKRLENYEKIIPRHRKNTAFESKLIKTFVSSDTAAFMKLQDALTKLRQQPLRLRVTTHFKEANPKVSGLIKARANKATSPAPHDYRNTVEDVISTISETFLPLLIETLLMSASTISDATKAVLVDVEADFHTKDGSSVVRRLAYHNGKLVSQAENGATIFGGQTTINSKAIGSKVVAETNCDANTKRLEKIRNLEPLRTIDSFKPLGRRGIQKNIEDISGTVRNIEGDGNKISKISKNCTKKLLKTPDSRTTDGGGASVKHIPMVELALEIFAVRALTVMSYAAGWHQDFPFLAQNQAAQQRSPAPCRVSGLFNVLILICIYFSLLHAPLATCCLVNVCTPACGTDLNIIVNVYFPLPTTIV